MSINIGWYRSRIGKRVSATAAVSLFALVGLTTIAQPAGATACNVFDTNVPGYFHRTTAAAQMINPSTSHFSMKESDWLSYARLDAFIPAFQITPQAIQTVLQYLSIPWGYTVIPVGMGDNRGFVTDPHPKTSRAHFNLDFEDGYGQAIMNSSRVNYKFFIWGQLAYTQTIDYQARPITKSTNMGGGGNRFWVDWITTNVFRLQYSLVNGFPAPEALMPAIDHEFWIDLVPREHYKVAGDAYPSVESHQYISDPCAQRTTKLQVAATNIGALSGSLPDPIAQNFNPAK